MLKGRSKSFAPKSVPRAPKRKGQDDAQEPAKQVSMTPDRPTEPTPEITRVEKRKGQDYVAEPPAKRVSTASDRPSLPTPQTLPSGTTATPENTPAAVQATFDTNASNSITSARAISPSANTRPQPDTQDVSMADDVVNSDAPATEAVPGASTAPKLQSASQDTSQTVNNTVTDVAVRDPPLYANAAPESESTAPAATNNVEAPPAPNNTSQTSTIQESILSSIEPSDNVVISHNERALSPLLTPAHRTSAEPSDFRYPSPESIARLVESAALGTPANMGPPGGQLGAAGDTAAIMRTGEIVQMATLNPDGTTGGIIVEEPPSSTEKGKKKKKVVRRKKILAVDEDGNDRATIDMGLTKARRQDNKRPRKKKTKKTKDGSGKTRKEREETPSDAEEEEIDQATLTMQDLCKDLRIGKKFSRHDEIKEREVKRKQATLRNKVREEQPDLAPRIDAEDQADEARFAAMAAAAAERAAAASGTNSDPATGEVSQPDTELELINDTQNPSVQMQVVNGQIVINEASTHLNRQKEGAAGRVGMEIVEENEFSKVITSGTYLKREKNNSWDAVATDKFYKYLGQFGTDFETIAKLFPGKNRRQIKLKFNTEERKNEAKITRYLTQPKAAMDLSEFEKRGLKLESVEAIEADNARHAAEKEAELDAAAEKLVADDRAKKAQIAATSGKRMSERDGGDAGRILASVEMGSDDEDEAPRRSAGESSKENAAPATGKGKRKAGPKKPRKNKHSQVAGGDEVFVLGTIE
jgi:transcription factor TFIIIB component B''